MAAWAGAYFRYYQQGMALQEYVARYRVKYGISSTYGSFRGARLEASASAKSTATVAL
jgi:hypothetical protein